MLWYITILFKYIPIRMHTKYNNNVLYKDYTREHCGSTCRDIREGIIRGNGYVVNIKYRIYIITSYLYTSYCCNVYINDNLCCIYKRNESVTLSLILMSAPTSNRKVTTSMRPP